MHQNILQVSLGEDAISYITSRSTISVFFENILKVATLYKYTELKIIIDFKGIDFVTRSAAHQLLIEKESFENQFHNSYIVFRNKNNATKKMLEIIEKTYKKNEKLNLNIPIYEITNPDELQTLIGF